MKYTYSEYRQKAWDSLTGKWGAAALLMLVYMVIAGVISSISGSGTEPSWRMIFLLLNLALWPMAFFLTVAFLNVAKGEDLPKVAALFDPYKDKETCIRYFLVEFWKNLFIFLWMLLLVIPGIIKAYAYAMTEYIAAENPNMDPREAMKKSEEMMKGHKWELFVLDLTFIGWLLLCVLTAGILMLFVQPYIYTAHAHFYLSLKDDLTPEGTEAKKESAAAPVVESAKAEASEAKAEKPAEPVAEEPAHAPEEPEESKPVEGDSAEK